MLGNASRSSLQASFSVGSRESGVLSAASAASRQVVRTLPSPSPALLPVALEKVARTAATWTMHAKRPSQSPSGEPTRVLFVCLGNICRSPTAEAVFENVVKRKGLQSQFVIDSCGTGGGHPDWYKKGGYAYHEGDESDQRMKETAATRGIELTSRSRPLRPQDMTEFDYIIGMDFQNITTIQKAADYWQEHFDVPQDYRRKVKIMGSFMPATSRFKGVLEVPDPWFDDDAERRGFYRVLDLLDEACEGLLDSIMASTA